MWRGRHGTSLRDSWEAVRPAEDTVHLILRAALFCVQCHILDWHPGEHASFFLCKVYVHIPKSQIWWCVGGLITKERTTVHKMFLFPIFLSLFLYGDCLAVRQQAYFYTWSNGLQLLGNPPSLLWLDHYKCMPMPTFSGQMYSKRAWPAAAQMNEVIGCFNTGLYFSLVQGGLFH